MCHRGGEIDQDAELYQAKSPLLKAGFLKTNDMVEKEVYNELSNRFLQLEKHCISLEISMQQKEESFQKIVWPKLLCREFEKLNKKNEHLKQTYKELYDSIKKTRIQTKDHNDSLIAQVNSKTVENADLKAQIQEKVNSRAKVQSPKIRNNNPVEPKNHTHKPGRRNGIGQRFSLNKSSAVHEKPHTPRSYLRWKPTGRIFKTVSLRWIPTGKVFIDSTTKVDSEPPKYISSSLKGKTRSLVTKKTDISYVRSSRNSNLMNMLQMTFGQNSSSLVLHLDDVWTKQFKPRSSSNDVWTKQFKPRSSSNDVWTKQFKPRSSSNDVWTKQFKPRSSSKDVWTKQLATPSLDKRKSSSPIWLRILLELITVFKEKESVRFSALYLQKKRNLLGVKSISLTEAEEAVAREVHATHARIVHENLKLITDERVIEENPESHSGSMSSMKNLDDTYNFGDQFLYDKLTEDDQEKSKVIEESDSTIPDPSHQTVTSTPPVIAPFTDVSSTKPSSLVTPPPINTEATTIITSLPEITPFISLQLRVARLEQEMSEVKKTDHSADVLASIKSRGIHCISKFPSIYIQLFWNTLTHDAKTGRSLLHDNIVPKPDLALELGKSISLTEAEEEAVAREVHATHARIVSESEPEPTQRRQSGIAFRDSFIVSKKRSSDSSKKLKGIQTLTPAEQEAADIMKALKESKKMSKRQPGTGGSNEGTGNILGVPDESTVISRASSEGTGSKPGVPDEEKLILYSGLVPQPPSPTPNVPPTKNDWDLLFCPMLDEYFNPSPSVAIVQEPFVLTGTPSSTRIDQDTPSTSTSQTTQEEQSHVIPTSVEEDDHGIEVPHMDNDL
ncbi:hypothetical protein Tco_1124326 [Tanacetum coccineum]|uniref:Uncharacterized protein n=1 Tax=Tanacetum coccineum TaxID=301880 RepID=A0ABQ5J6X0_9ASTR